MRVKIGIVAKPFGIRGEIKVRPVTDFVDERFYVGAKMFMVKDKSTQVVEIESMRGHQDALLIKFKGWNSLTDVEGLQLSTLEIERDEMHDLEDGEYYFVDLLDLNVDVDGKIIGHVIEVMDLPAHPVLRIEKEDKSVVMIPFVKVFIKDVDREQKVIYVNSMEGLL